MNAATVDLDITQGSTFNVRIAVKDCNSDIVDLTGFEVRGAVKRKFSDSNSNILINLDPVVYNATEGLIDILLTADKTALLPITEALYDIEKYPLTNANHTEQILKGKFLIHPEITSGVDADYN
jgi:hypothetical protein|tara:strand:- start:1612 stop:1983 length:372 start_codon:yes stop_codon:yes gene_type:complete